MQNVHSTAYSPQDVIFQINSSFFANSRGYLLSLRKYNSSLWRK